MEKIARMRLNQCIERLIGIVRKAVEGARQLRQCHMRIQRVGIVGGTHAESPGQFARELPGILRIQIDVEEVERLRIRNGKRSRRGRRDSVDELRQIGIGNRRRCPLAEVIVVEPENAGIRAEPKVMRARSPCEVVVDEKARGASALNPCVVLSAERAERCAAAGTLQHDRERRQCLLQVRGTEQAFVPRERRVEVIHQMRRKDVCVARGEGIERLRRDGVKQRINRIGVSGLKPGIGLYANPQDVVRSSVVIYSRRLHLLVVGTRLRHRTPHRTTVPVWGTAPRR